MDEQEIHLRDYIKVIRKRKSTVATFFLITFTVVLIGTFSATPLYQASTQILVEKSDSAPLTSRYYYSNQFDPEFFETQSQIIKSQNVAKKVVKLLSLDTTYESYFPTDKNAPSVFSSALSGIKTFFTGLFTSSDAKGSASDAVGSQPEKTKADIIANSIKAGIVVSPVQESRLLYISYRSENPEFARLVANTIVTAYMEELMAIKLNSSGYAIKWMTEKADTEKAKLARSEKALQAFMKEHDIITVEDRIAIVPQKLVDITGRLTAAETRRKELETVRIQIDKLRRTDEEAETIPLLAKDKTLQSLRSQILKSEQNIKELSQKYGEKHPLMIKARADVKILREKKKQEIKKSIQSIRNEYELASQNEESTRRLLERTKNEALNLNEKFIQYGILKREVDTNMAMYDALSTRIKEQGVTEETQKVNVWATEEAEFPGSPIKPKKMRNILLGAILGLFGGVGLAFFLEYLDNTVKDPDDLEMRTGTSVLGVIELYTNKDNKNVELASSTDTKSTFAECFKALRTSVLLSSADRPPKRLLVTSMSAKEGKTTIAANLAATLAMSENTVLLVDADMRRPSIHKVFEVPNSKGLSSYLAGAAKEKIIHKIDEMGLSVIPSGPVPPNPSELLTSGKLKSLLQTLDEKFDFIIIDSAPVMGATDSLLLSKAVDGTIIVGRAGQTTYDLLGKGLKSFKEIESPVLGMVINAMDMKKSEYQYYYGYYNYNYTSEGDA